MDRVERGGVVTALILDTTAWPPAPIGGWPLAVTARRKFQWNRRRHIGERLYSRVERRACRYPQLGDCWVWTGARTGPAAKHSGQRQGAIGWRERYASPQKVHRVAWEIWNGQPIPDGRQVNHHCDEMVCCNPAHLYLGTQVENLRDASVRGRSRVPRTKVFTVAQRLAIFNEPYRPNLVRDLAAAHGVTSAAISIIRSGRFVREEAAS